MAYELAQAYVQIIPSTKGIGSSLKDSLGNAGEKAGKSAGKRAGAGISSGLTSKMATVGKAAGVALGAATAAVGAFAVSSVSAGAEFDAAMSGVAATMGTTTEEIQDLRDFALEMGSKTAFSATEAAQALNYMALAGYDSETAMSMLPSVLSLAAAGEIDLASASDMVTDAQSALGLTTEETETMVDQMAQTASKSNTSVEQLGEAILTIGATGRSVKGGTNELATVLGVLADNGIKGAEGGTHLRNILLSLQNPTETGADLLDQLGVSVYDADGNMRSMTDIIGDMQTGMEGMSDEAKNAMISGIFNKTDLASVNALLGTSTDRFDELSTAIGESHGAAEQMANTKLDNLQGDVTLFKSALEGAKIAISDQLTPSLRSMTQFGTNAITTLSTAFQQGGLSGAMTALGQIVSDGLAMLIESLPKFVEAGMQLLSSIGMGILQNLPALVEAGMTILTTLLTGITNNLPVIIPAIITVVLQIVDVLTKPETIEMLANAGVELLLALVDNLPAIIAGVVKAVGAVINAIITALKAIWKRMPEIFKNAWEAVKKIFANVPQWFKDKFKGAWDKIKAIFAGFKEFFKQKWDALKNVFASVPTWFKEKFKAAWDKIKAAWSKVKEWFKAIWTSIKNTFNNIPTWFKEKFAGAWTKIKGAWSKVKEWFKNIWTSLKNTFSAVPAWFKEKFLGAWTKIKESWSGVKTWFKGIWTSLKEFFKSVPTWFKEKFKTAWTNIKTVFSPIKNWFKNVWSGIKETFAKVPAWFKEKFSSAWTKVKNVFSTGGKIFDGIKDGISNVFTSVVNKIIGGINRVIAVPFNAINGVLNKIRNVSILGVKPFSSFWGQNPLSVPQIPTLARGGILNAGEIGLLEGTGAEAVVPLENNERWIHSVAMDMEAEFSRGSAGQMDDLISEVEEIGRRLDNLRVVLDTGALVGGISSRMNQSLGNNSRFKERGVAMA